MTEGAAGLPEGYSLKRFDSLDSTMIEAERQAAAGAPDGTLIQALEQTAGRGRRGKSWSTPPGNLALSLVLRPKVALREAALYGFVAGLSLHDALAPHVEPSTRLRLKWPNDLLLDGAKLSGLLLECRGSSESEPEWLILGMGVNVAWAPEDTPYPSTALASHLVPLPSLEQLTVGWARCFARWRQAFEGQGFETLRTAWKAAAAGLGGALEARLADGQVLAGRFVDLAEDGSLLLAMPGQARPRSISAAEVYFPEGAIHAAGH